MRRNVLISLLLLVPATAFGQTRFEVTPFIGVRTGGAFRAVEQDIALKAKPSFGGGVMFDYRLNETMALEFLWSHQSTDVELLDVSAVPGADAVENPPSESPTFGIGVDYFHGDFVYGGGPTIFHPYVLIGGGVARLNPDVSAAPATSKFSFSVGTGFRSYFTERLGLRVDARAFGTRIGDKQEDVACGVFGCVSFERASTFWQGQIVGGLVIAF